MIRLRLPAGTAHAEGAGDRGHDQSDSDPRRPAAPTRTTLPAPRLARAVTTCCLCAFALLAVVNVAAVGLDTARLLVCLGAVGVVFTLQYLHCSPRARTWSASRKAWTLSAQATVTYLPMVAFGIGWGGMAGPLAASVLLAVVGRVAWVLFGLIGASMAIFPPALGATPAQTIYLVVSTLLIGLVLYCLARLTDLIHEVHAARGELARLAVAEERLRFARDLHDLLGYSLSSITLKSELVYRLVPSQADRAREEIASILQIARQALADVRMVASGYRELSLLEEVASAESILTAADIGVKVTTSVTTDLPSGVDTVLAAALREGVTNILRHSNVRCCQMLVVAKEGRVRLKLSNDGLTESPDARPRHSGSGLGNLHARVADVGGRLEAGVRDDGRFHLVVDVPLGPEPPGLDPDGVSLAVPGGKPA